MSVPNSKTLKQQVAGLAKEFGLKDSEAQERLARAIYKLKDWQTLLGTSARAAAAKVTVRDLLAQNKELLDKLLDFLPEPDLEEDEGIDPRRGELLTLRGLIESFLAKAKTPMKRPGLKGLLEAATEHAMGSGEPDMEVGDLQELLRAATRQLTPTGWAAFIASGEIDDLAEAEPSYEAWRAEARQHLVDCALVDPLPSPPAPVVTPEEAPVRIVDKPNREITFYIDAFETNEFFVDPKKELSFVGEENFGSSVPLPDELYERLIAEGAVTTFFSTFPRASRYGYPEVVTDRGGRAWVLDFPQIHLDPEFAVRAEDSGDDSIQCFWLTFRVPEDLATAIEAACC